MKYVVLSEKKWNRDLAEHLALELGGDWILIDRKQDFSPKKLDEIKPDRIFIPHWSHFIPESIFDRYECIVFHMTDLPYGRGGSPLQNLIIRGNSSTKISALRVVQALDAGDIYLKMPLTLEGTAEEIFIRANRVIGRMIKEIIENNPAPVPQSGESTVFARRKPEQSNIQSLSDLTQIYDYIRMLDADGYPKAFLEAGDFRFEFSGASLKEDHSITANVRIIKK